MPSRFSRLLVTALTVLALLLVAAGANAVIPPDSGAYCGNSGKTPGFYQIYSVWTPVCSSYKTGFFAYRDGGGNVYCGQFGYQALVYSASNVLRYQSYFCADGLIHWSTAAASNERRYSGMRINGNGVNWSMGQYTR
jgi:hypothetical protein